MSANKPPSSPSSSSLSDCVKNMIQRFGYDQATATAVCQKLALRQQAKDKMNQSQGFGSPKPGSK